MIKNFLNPKGHQNPFSCSIVTANLLKGVDLAYWWGCIGKCLRLQPAQQACFIPLHISSKEVFLFSNTKEAQTNIKPVNSYYQETKSLSSICPVARQAVGPTPKHPLPRCDSQWLASLAQISLDQPRITNKMRGAFCGFKWISLYIHCLPYICQTKLHTVKAVKTSLILSNKDQTF